jgi:hypothetical protein
MNSSTPIPWDSSNNASILLIKFGSLYFILITTGTPSTIVGFVFGKTTISYLVTNTSSIPLDILML